MTVIVKHNKTNTITDWTQTQLDEQIALGNFPSGTTLANIVLPSDWNNDHTLTGLGTMAEQDATAVAITGGTINNTTIGATTATTGRFTSVTTPSVTATTNNLTLSAISTGTVTINTAAANNTFLLVKDDLTASPSTTGLTVLGASSGLGRLALRSNKALYIASGSSNNINFLTNSGVTSEGSTQMAVAHTTSAVNYVQVTGGATTAKPVISAQGSDSNITLALSGKGGGVQLYQNGTSSPLMFEAVAVGSAVNYFRASPSITAQAVPLSAQGTDTNISMAFQPKGTGAIDLAAGSRGVNISNGGTVTAITRTGNGTGYTSKPTIAIIAPTTAGGVQATATIDFMSTNATAIVSGGTGYTVGNVLTVVGGTPVASATTMTVATVSSGVITSVTIANFGSYSTLPTNPVSVTGGTGSSATFNITYSIGNAFTISNAGSGYIEQPTITFSGGGGSGAAAYATVGSGTIVRGISSTVSIYSAGGEQARFGDTFASGTSANYWLLQGRSAGAQPAFGVAGTDTNISAQYNTKGTGSFAFWTNNGAQQQFAIQHTASAVNYVQVTGSATGNNPNISVQGSDANVGLRLYSKGTFGVSAWTNGGASRQFQVEHTAGTIVNYATATGSATGSAPVFSVAGTDTNIDLALTPKGTGLVRFGTYVAGALLATGYINIKAADGTTYKVLVST